MASSATTNYKLNQWAATDKVIMSEWNKDNAAIESALSAKLDTTGTAASAITASKLGANTVGSATVPIYLLNGAPTAVPKVAAASKADTATTATSASKIGSASVGNATTPIYLNTGTPTACSALATSASYNALQTRIATLEKSAGLLIRYAQPIANTSAGTTMASQSVATFQNVPTTLSNMKMILLVGGMCQCIDNIDPRIASNNDNSKEFNFTLPLDPNIFATASSAKYFYGVGVAEAQYTKDNVGINIQINSWDAKGTLKLLADPQRTGKTADIWDWAPLRGGYAGTWNHMTKYTPRLTLIMLSSMNGG